MSETKDKEFRKLFNKVRRKAKEFTEINAQLGRWATERWGFDPSDTDDDPIIDTIDYGTSSISFEEFVKRMDEYKNNLESTGKFGCIP